jgi:hypothetical protein
MIRRLRKKLHFSRDGMNDALLVLAFLLANLLTFPVTRLLDDRLSKSTRFCRFNRTEPATSTPRDVTFLFATKATSGLLLSLKSLRSTGALCRIILLISRRFRRSAAVAVFLREMGVEVSFCPNPSNRSLVPHMLRYECELAWLRAHPSDVDRVLHTDAFDVFFQGDPFTRQVPRHHLTIVVEPHCIRSCGWNLGWINECYGGIARNEFAHRFIVCSGTISGNAVEYQRLVELMMKQKEWKSCWKRSLDQPILNWLLWKGVVASEGIPYRLVGCDSGFFTMQWCVTERKILMDEYNQVMSMEGVVPSYLHQYDRYPRFAAYARGICDM